MLESIAVSLVLGCFGAFTSIVIQRLSAKRKQEEQYRRDKIEALQRYMECYGRVFCGASDIDPECELMAATYRACLFVSSDTRDFILDLSYRISPRVSSRLEPPVISDADDIQEIDIAQFLGTYGTKVCEMIKAELSTVERCQSLQPPMSHQAQHGG